MKKSKLLVTIILSVLILSTFVACNNTTNTTIFLTENALSSNIIEITTNKEKRKIIKIVDTDYDVTEDELKIIDSIILTIDKTSYYIIKYNIYKNFNNQIYKGSITEKNYNYIYKIIKDNGIK